MKEAYRNFKVWEEAINLSLQVHGLIESLPAGEKSALAVSLNAAAINIPTTIAVNLIQMDSPNIHEVIGLQTQLEIIERIYPALDSADVTEAASTLLARLQDPLNFRELLPQPEQPIAPAEITEGLIESEYVNISTDPDAESIEADIAADNEDNIKEPTQPTHVEIQS